MLSVYKCFSLRIVTPCLFTVFKATNNDNSIFTQNDTKHWIQNGDWKSGKWIACHKLCHSLLITAEKTSEEKHEHSWDIIILRRHFVRVHCYVSPIDIGMKTISIEIPWTLNAHQLPPIQESSSSTSALSMSWWWWWIRRMAMKSSKVFFLIEDAVVVRLTTGTTNT